MKIALETLGCKLNQAETETLARQFLEAGNEVVNSVEEAEIYILNTCTVTYTADSKSRHMVRQARRRNPTAKIVVTGCASKGLAGIDGIDLVVANNNKNELFRQLVSAGFLENGLSSSPGNGSTLSPALRTRAFVKIQDGCTNFCTYCIVPYVRGDEKSVDTGTILNTVKKRVDEGYREIVLTGTRIGAYETQGIRLKELVERILRETKVQRLRLSSLQPQELSPELIKLWRDSRLCPHFHLSLQSGSESVLASMNRRYTAIEFENAVSMIRSVIPDVAITTDVIVGFPGETDAEFEESLEFCRRMEFARIHVFIYSPRAGTVAANMPEQIADSIKKERSKRMLALSKDSVIKFQEKFSGATLDVLWEKQTGAGVWSGVTGNYIRVYRRDKTDLTNKIGHVSIE